MRICVCVYGFIRSQSVWEGACEDAQQALAASLWIRCVYVFMLIFGLTKIFSTTHSHSHTRIHSYTHTHKYVHTYVRAYTHAPVHTCTRTHTHTPIHTYTHNHTHVHTHTKLCTHTRMITHIHTHTHAHAYKRMITHIHTHIHVHTHTHAHTHDLTHTHIHPHIQIHTHTHAYTHDHTHTHAHTCTCIHPHIRVHTHTHAYTRMITHTYTRIHTHDHTGDQGCVTSGRRGLGSCRESVWPCLHTQGPTSMEGVRDKHRAPKGVSYQHIRQANVYAGKQCRRRSRKAQDLSTQCAPKSVWCHFSKCLRLLAVEGAQARRLIMPLTQCAPKSMCCHTRECLQLLAVKGAQARHLILPCTQCASQSVWCHTRECLTEQEVHTSGTCSCHAHSARPKACLATKHASRCRPSSQLASPCKRAYAPNGAQHGVNPGTAQKIMHTAFPKECKV